LDSVVVIAMIRSLRFGRQLVCFVVLGYIDDYYDQTFYCQCMRTKINGNIWQ